MSGGRTWFCELHRISTSTDCPKCDAEQIADLERYRKLPSCHTCKRTLREGESAYVADWKVLKVYGQNVTTVLETRYTCDDCEAKR